MSEFVSNVFKLVSGSLIAQILAILLIPIITRLYTPEDFGFFTLIISIATIIAVFSNLSYQLSIMLPKDHEDAANIVTLCCILILFSSIITGVVIFLFADPIAYALNAPKITSYLMFLPIIVFFSAVFTVLTYWNSRRKRYGVYAIAQISNSLSSRLVQISAGLTSASPIGLIAGYITGYLFAITVMLQGFRGDWGLFRQVTKKRMKELAVRYKKFPLFAAWSNTSLVISTQIAPLLLVYFYSPVVVGYYAIAIQVVQMPLTLIGSAVGQVFFQKACEIKNTTSDITHIVHEVHRRLISIGIFPMLLLLIIGEDLFAIVLGLQWYTAGIFAKILSPWLLLVFIASPLSVIFSILERQQIELSFNISILFSRISVLCIGGIFLDPIWTLILFSITGVIFWGGLNLYLLKISNISYRDGMIDYLHYFLIGLAIASPLIILKVLWPQSVYFLCAAGVIVTIIYYALIVSRDEILKTSLFKIIGR